MTHRIVFLDRDTIGPGVDLIRPAFAHDWVDYPATAPGEVADRIAGATVVITNKVPIDAAAIARAAEDGLAMIQVAATGYDVVDMVAARAAGIPVSNVRGYARNTVPEHTFALILALRRGLIGYRRDVADGEWTRSGGFTFFAHPVSELAGAVLGIIGAGANGRRVADIARAFGMVVRFAAHKGAHDFGSLYTPFERVIAESDIITLHCPLNAQTRDLIAQPEFEQMARRPLLINTARGGLVNEADLLAALDRGLIAGFGFDTLVNEPPAADDPMIRALDRPNVIVTPHAAWASAEARQALWNQAVDQIERFERGDDFNRVA